MSTSTLGIITDVLRCGRQEGLGMMISRNFCSILTCRNERYFSIWNDVLIEVGLTPGGETSRWWHVRTLGVLEDDTYYECGFCSGGYFDMYLECYKNWRALLGSRSQVDLDGRQRWI
jgi:hypothetical protein